MNVEFKAQSSKFKTENMKTYINFTKEAFKEYDFFKEKSLAKRRIKHSQIKELIKKHEKSHVFEIERVGESIRNRDIWLVKAGTGKTKVMLWSQMHGDESTATQALFDVFNFLAKTDFFTEIKKQILRFDYCELRRYCFIRFSRNIC